MKQFFVLLVIAICALPLRGLAQHKSAEHQAADNVCVADRAAASSTPIEDQEVLRATLGETQAQADDRWYLLETAWTSATMTRQGPQVAIARLNPKFAARLASAIRDARGSGLPFAGIFSAYRPPAFGVGRFLDRFNSLHAYGLAVDMRGIGEPGSKEAKLWYDVAGRHGIVCPYGVDSRREWNHCQPTPARAVCRDDPLRKTITAEAPIDLDEMFKAGDQFVANPPATCAVVAANRPADSEVTVPNIAPQFSHAAPAAAAAASARAERKNLSDALYVEPDVVSSHEAHAAFARSDRKHLHDARDVDGAAVTRSRRSDHEELERMVAHDMGLHVGPSHPRARAAATRLTARRHAANRR